MHNNGQNGIQIQQSKGVKIEDSVNIRKNGEHGVTLASSSNIHITNNHAIEGNGKDGIHIESSYDVEIRGNQSIQENMEKGISVYSSWFPHKSPIQIMGNDIVGNRSAGKQKIGVYVDGSWDVRIGAADSPNTIRSHKENGVSLVNAAAHNQVVGNTIRLNDDNGVYVNASCDNTIESNTIGEENGDGVEFDHAQCPSSANQVMSNVIQQNLQNGVYLTASYGNAIGDKSKPNTIKQNKNGVKLEDADAPTASPNVIAGNVIRDNHQHGVYLLRSDFNTVGEENQIGPNSEHGVHIESSLGDAVRNNEIKGEKAQKDGVFVRDSGELRIEDNEIQHHARDGIHVESSGTTGPIRITGNSIAHNGKNAVHAIESCSVWVGIWDAWGSPVYKANTLGAGNETGVRVEGGACPTAYANWIAHNTIQNNRVGVWVENAENVRIGEKNQIDHQSGDGVYVLRAKGVEVSDNTIGPSNQTGVHVAQSQAATGVENEIMGNAIERSASHGILVEDSYGVRIGGTSDQSNRITHNSGDGVRLRRAASTTSTPAVTVQGNAISDGNRNGIFLMESDNNLIEENIVTDSLQDGIHLHRSNQNKIYENSQVDENGWHGVYLKWSQGNEIMGNGIGRNKMSGVFLYESRENFIPPEKQKGNAITENEEHGIRLDASHYNAIYDNEIKKNGKDGIHLNYSRRNWIGGALKIEENGGDGIMLESSVLNNIEGPGFKKVNNRLKWGAWVYKNGQNGIHFKNASYNWLTRYKTYRHAVGIFIEANSNFNKFQDVLISLNGVGVREYNSHDNNYGASTFVFNVVAVERSGSSGVVHAAAGQAGSQAYLSGCTITDSETDGVRTDRGAGFTIRKCHIYDNGGAGVNNLDSSVTISAQDNWWGDASGPGGAGPGSGEEISGSVDYANWRTEPFTLTVAPAADMVRAARGAPGSAYFFVQNRETLSDTVTVALTDALGWLQPPTAFTVTLNGPSAAIPISFTVPATAALGMTDTVTATVISQANPALTDADSLQVMASLIADLSAQHEVSTDPAAVNQSLTYTVVVTNDGPDNATGVTLVDTLPSEVTFAKAETTQGSCAEVGGVVTCDLGVMNAHQEITVTVEVTPTMLGTILNVVDVVGAEYDPAPAIHIAKYVTVERRMYLPLYVHQP